MKRLILIAITMIFSSALVHAYDYENQRRLQARDSGKPLTKIKQKETQSTKQKKQKTAQRRKNREKRRDSRRSQIRNNRPDIKPDYQ
jgi:hypothetical protein